MVTHRRAEERGRDGHAAHVVVLRCTCSVAATSRCLVRLIHVHIVVSLNILCMCALRSHSGSDACTNVWRNHTGITHTVLSTELQCWLTVVVYTGGRSCCTQGGCASGNEDHIARNGRLTTVCCSGSGAGTATTKCVMVSCGLRVAGLPSRHICAQQHSGYARLAELGCMFHLSILCCIVQVVKALQC
jgi:hypothetical protein